MKRVIILLIILISVITQAKAQRYLPKQHYLEAKVGSIDGRFIGLENFYAGVGFSSYKRNCNHWLFGLEYLQKSYEHDNEFMSRNQFSVESGYFHNLLSDRAKTISLSIGGSLMIGYETSQWKEKILYNDTELPSNDSFIYGGAVTLEMNVYLSDWAILLINARERILWGSTIGRFHSQIGMGFKFLIN